MTVITDELEQLYAELQDRGACKGVDPDLMFPVGDGHRAQRQIAKAKAVCAQCTVRAQCLQYALAIHEEHGVWGGTSEVERREMFRKQRAERKAS